MTLVRHPAMTEALRLTRTGHLADATRAIQAALSGNAHADTEGGHQVIDLTPGRRRAPDAAPEVRPQGGFHQRSYRGFHGVLDYMLYVPAGAVPMMPLVVMLHGCTQSPADFARGTDMNRVADEHGLIVAYPGQTRAANAQKCWNWFRPEDQRHGSGEPARIAAVTQQIIRDHGCDPARIYVAGLSAGGAAAAIMGAAYPDLYAAIGVHSGLACGAARDMPSAFSAMRMGGTATGHASAFVPVITFHGDQDSTVSEINSRHIIAAASLAAGKLETHQETGTSAGRRFTRLFSRDEGGVAVIERWTIHGAGHAWSGGTREGSYTDPSGPDASREMVRFFLETRKA